MRAVLPLFLCIALCGCSGVYMPNVGMNRTAAPFPSDYRQTVRTYADGAGDPGTLVSSPRQMSAWSVYDPAAWYVCLRRPGTGDVVYQISGSRIAGVIEKPDPAFCANAEFTPIAAG